MFKLAVWVLTQRQALIVSIDIDSADPSACPIQPFPPVKKDALKRLFRFSFVRIEAHILRARLELLPEEEAVFKRHIAVRAALLGDGYRAGIYICIVLMARAFGDVRVPV